MKFSRKPSVLLAFGAIATLSLTACGTAPLSFLDTHLQLSSQTKMHIYPVRVIAVDGDYSLQNPLPVAPGTHILTVNAGPGQGARTDNPKTFPFTVEACTRYYLEAHRESPMSADWQLMVERKEDVGGCDPEKEMSKAKSAKTGEIKTS